MLTRFPAFLSASICKRAREKMQCSYIDLPCEKEDGKCEVIKYALYCPALGFETGLHKQYSGLFVEAAEDWLDEKNWEKEKVCPNNEES